LKKIKCVNNGFSFYYSANTMDLGVEEGGVVAFEVVQGLLGLQDPQDLQTSRSSREASAGTTLSTIPSPDLAGGNLQTRKNLRLKLNHAETGMLAQVSGGF
jgi:hypothetical protein